MNSKWLISSDLEVLKIKADNLIKLSLPGNLREVMICTGQKPVEFECEEMDQLKYLKLILPFFISFGDLGIVAANLESLNYINVINCCIVKIYINFNI